ncbi:MAG TPA: methyltransferase domain-containing protein [Anaerolineales bacterium]|nr:methyltransferase domain-containing protein [Anaerolineales bacterium]
MPTIQPITLPARLDKEAVNAVYRGIAPLYDIWGALTETKARSRCLEVADIRDGESVLEVAVGTGLTFAEILKRNPSGFTEGVDLTSAMLERARKRAAAIGGNNYVLNVGDAYHLDVADATFDVVVKNFMFDLLPEPDFAIVLAEFKRVLRPGGRLVLANMAHARHWHHRLWETVYNINPAWMGGCRGVALEGPMRAQGFVNLQREFVSQMTFPAEIVSGIKPER